MQPPIHNSPHSPCHTSQQAPRRPLAPAPARRAPLAPRAQSPRAVAATTVMQEPGTVLMSAVEKWNGDKRLQTQVFQLAQDTIAIRSLDYDRDRFDIEFG